MELINKMKDNKKLIMIFHQIPFIFALIIVLIFSIALFENLLMSYQVQIALIALGFIGFLLNHKIRYVRILGGLIGLSFGQWIYKLGGESTHTSIGIYAGIAFIIFYSGYLLFHISKISIARSKLKTGDTL